MSTGCNECGGVINNSNTNTGNNCGCPKKSCESKKCLDMCHERAELISELSTFRNALVYVAEDKKTYHVDCDGNAYAVSGGLVFEDNHVAIAGQYKGVDVFDSVNTKRYIYDLVGNVYSVVYTLEASV